MVGAGGRVLGAGPADDVLMDLVPLVLVVTSAEQMPDSPHNHGNRGNGWGLRFTPVQLAVTSGHTCQVTPDLQEPFDV